MQYVFYVIAEPIFEKHPPTFIASKMNSAAEGNDSPVKGREMASSEEMEPLTPAGGSGSPKTTPTRHFEQGKPYANSKVLNWSP